MNVHDYILENFPKSIRDPKKNKKDLPNEYMTPCAEGIFQNFYYWDTYFINVGLLAEGNFEMAEKNLNVMKHFVDRYGFIPNADHLLKGSQPPLFTRGVYDLYLATKDERIIRKFVFSAMKEMEFWRGKRMTEIGLNQYRCGFSDEDCLNAYDYFASRSNGLNEIEKAIDKIQMVRDFYAIAESGWDLNSRYWSKGNRFAAHEFVNLDLNCILYDAERKIGEMLSLIGEKEASAEYQKRAKQRKELIDKFLKKDGIYLDYDFVHHAHSHLLSAASLYPYALGISDDQASAKKVFLSLRNEFGLSSSVDFEGADKMQWDFPNMWPPMVYFAYLALRNVGLKGEAEWLSKTYRQVVERNFEKTHHLWEKYDTLTGEVSYSFEYETPTMLGWTAGIYEFLWKEANHE